MYLNQETACNGKWSESMGEKIQKSPFDDQPIEWNPRLLECYRENAS